MLFITPALCGWCTARLCFTGCIGSAQASKLSQLAGISAECISRTQIKSVKIPADLKLLPVLIPVPECLQVSGLAGDNC